MPNFPMLKTSAVAQYPAQRSIRFRNEAVRFLDGSEQRYRDSAGALHRWRIRLEQLDEAEIAALEDFFLGQQGAFGEFAFTDPWDGQIYANCSMALDQIESRVTGEAMGSTVLVIMENR